MYNDVWGCAEILPNNFPFIFIIFTFLSDFKSPALAICVVNMATREAFFDLSVVYDVLFWQPSSKRAGFNETLYVVLFG